MSFAVLTQEADGLDQVILEDKNTFTRVIILPQHGASLHAIIVRTARGEVNVVDQYADKVTLQNEIRQSFKSSKLSPFACKTAHARYRYNGTAYEFAHKHVDGSAIHGLLFDKAFKTVDLFCDDNQAGVLLKYIYNGEDHGYPFRYRCEINYTLFAESLVSVQTTIINLDDDTIPLADGWHPYFMLGGRIDSWLMRVNAESVVELDENGIPTGQMIPYTGALEETPIDDAELDHCYLLKSSPEYAACTLHNPSADLSISVFPDQSYPYLLVYTPAHRKSIAIENLSAAPDHLNNGMGTIMLAPGHSKTFTVHYKIVRE